MLRVSSTVPNVAETQGEHVKVPAPKLYSGMDSLGLRAIRGKEHFYLSAEGITLFPSMGP